MNRRDLKEKIEALCTKKVIAYETSTGELMRSPYDADTEELRLLFLNVTHRFKLLYFDIDELKKIWMLLYLYGPEIKDFIEKIETIEQERDSSEKVDVGSDLIIKWSLEQDMDECFDECDGISEDDPSENPEDEEEEIR